MIAAVIVMVLVALSYANTVLDDRLAENEFNDYKQFMLTTGLQINELSWILGRTHPVTYSSRFGHLKFQPLALTYSLALDSGSGWETVFSNITTGMIMYNIPIANYNLGNYYFERISPINNGSFLQQGPVPPVNHCSLLNNCAGLKETFRELLWFPQ